MSSLVEFGHDVWILVEDARQLRANSDLKEETYMNQPEAKCLRIGISSRFQHSLAGFDESDRSHRLLR